MTSSNVEICKCYTLHHGDLITRDIHRKGWGRVIESPGWQRKQGRAGSGGSEGGEAAGREEEEEK